MEIAHVDQGRVVCPICAATMRPSGRRYSVDELFAMWETSEFSHATVEEHKAQSESTQLHVCPKCELEMFMPQVIGTPNFYIDLQKAEQGAYYSDDKWDFREGLHDVQEASSIVEIGCGPGVFLQKAKSKAGRAIGQEYNQSALDKARKNGLEVFALEDDVSGLKGQFDVAFSFHVLEHVADPVEFVKEMLSWVKPGGKVGISVPNMGGPLKFLNPCVSNMPPHHATRWRAETFEALAGKLALKVERVKCEPLVAADQYYYSTYWVKQSWLARMLPVRCLQFLQALTFKALALVFNVLGVFGKQEFGLLKGQSIYVLLSKQDGR